MGEENIHKNHRQRMRKKVEEYGLESLPAHEVLEYLLFFAIPRQNTNPIAQCLAQQIILRSAQPDHNVIDHQNHHCVRTAHQQKFDKLLSRFGGFCQVLEASPEELAQVEGMGPASARFLHSLLQVSRYYQIEKRRQIRRLNTEEEAMEYVKPLFVGLKEEQIYAVILDDKNGVLRCEQLGQGLANSVEVSAGKLAKSVLLAGGTSVILAHNHPAGLPLPSPEDIVTTGKLVKALGVLGIDLVDHIVVAQEEATSMSKRQCMPIYDPLRGEVEYPRHR